MGTIQQIGISDKQNKTKKETTTVKTTSLSQTEPVCKELQGPFTYSQLISQTLC